MKINSLSLFDNVNDYIYIDANVFHFAIRGIGHVGDICTNFLRKVESGYIRAVTSPLVLDELMYKLLLKLIEEEYGSNPLKILRSSRKVDKSIFERVANMIATIVRIKNLEILDIPKSIIYIMPSNFKRYQLLPRDTLHISLMEIYDIKNIASADTDYDTVDWITRWTPLEEQT